VGQEWLGLLVPCTHRKQRGSWGRRPYRRQTSSIGRSNQNSPSAERPALLQMRRRLSVFYRHPGRWWRIHSGRSYLDHGDVRASPSRRQGPSRVDRPAQPRTAPARSAGPQPRRSPGDGTRRMFRFFRPTVAHTSPPVLGETLGDQRSVSTETRPGPRPPHGLDLTTEVSTPAAPRQPDHRGRMKTVVVTPTNSTRSAPQLTGRFFREPMTILTGRGEGKTCQNEPSQPDTRN